MPNYKALWANSSLRPTLFGVVDAYAGIPLILLAFDLDNLGLAKFALFAIALLTTLDYLGCTPQACYLSLRRIYGIYVKGGRRTADDPFNRARRRVMVR